MIQKNYGMDITVFIPYGILCFLFMNLFGTIPRMRISPETYIWKIEKTYIWRVKKIGKSMVLTLCVALILFWAFPMEGMVLRQFIVAMLCNPIVNMHTVLSTQYKYRDIMNICMLAVVMICFFNGSVFVTSILLIIYGLYFILYPYFSYQAIIPFFQQYNQMLYGFLNREYDTVLQTQDEVFFQNNQKEMKGLMKKYYGSRYRFLMVYEVVSIVRRKKQIMYQYFAIVLITMLLSQIDGKYIEYVLLFSILILGQNVVSYNVQNELRLGDAYALFDEKIEDSDRATVLISYAQEQAEIKKEREEASNQAGDSEFVKNVQETYPAIDIKFLCKDANYKPDIEIEFKFGVYVFWEIIVPHILKISELVGCKYVYLFAADNSEVPKTDVQMENTIKYSKDYDMGLEEDILDEETSSEEDVKKLVSYYINNLKFRPVSEYTILKPHFERTCYTLIQDVEDLQHKRESIWYSHDQDNEMGLNAE